MQGEPNKTMPRIDASPLLGRPRSVDFVEARCLLSALAQLEAAAVQEATAANARLFVAALRDRLQRAVERCELRPAKPLDPAERLEQEVELTWTMNQCRYWLAHQSMAGGRLSHDSNPVAAVRPMTFAEFAAVRALWRSVAWLGVFRRPKCRIHPAMIGEVAWLWASLRSAVRRGGRGLAAALRRWARFAAAIVKDAQSRERRTP